MGPPPRRWTLSPEEEERVAASRRALGARSGLVGLLRAPRLVPEAVESVIKAARSGILSDNSLISLLDAQAVRRAVPDAATGVGWYPEAGFLEALHAHLDRESVVLELGCGGGRISRLVAPHVARLVATDRSRTMVAEARANLAAFANVEVRRTDGRTLAGFPDASFSAVFAQGVLGYLDPNPLLALLDEVRRVLRPGGAAVFNFLTIDDPRNGREQLTTVRSQARRNWFHGATDRSYARAQIEAMYSLVGLSPVLPGAGQGQAEAERTVIVGISRTPAPADQ